MMFVSFSIYLVCKDFKSPPFPASNILVSARKLFILLFFLVFHVLFGVENLAIWARLSIPIFVGFGKSCLEVHATGPGYPYEIRKICIQDIGMDREMTFRHCFRGFGNRSRP